MTMYIANAQLILESDHKPLKIFLISTTMDTNDTRLKNLYVMTVMPGSNTYLKRLPLNHKGKNYQKAPPKK